MQNSALGESAAPAVTRAACGAVLSAPLLSRMTPQLAAQAGMLTPSRPGQAAFA